MAILYRLNVHDTIFLSKNICARPLSVGAMWISNVSIINLLSYMICPEALTIICIDVLSVLLFTYFSRVLLLDFLFKIHLNIF